MAYEQIQYDKKLFIDNVYFLAKEKDLKIGEIEAACGVSSGYLSRLRQGEKNVAPGADFLLSISAQLSASVDALLSMISPAQRNLKPLSSAILTS